MSGNSESKPVHHEHHAHHSAHKKENKVLNQIKNNPWMAVSIGLAIIIIFSLFNFGGVSKSEAGQVVLDFANSQTAGGVTLVSVGEKYGFYEVLLLYNGENIPLYLSKDGENIISGVTPVSGATTNTNTQVPTNTGSGADASTLVDDDAVRGDPNAPVTIVEWSDYECPFCGRFYAETLPSIMQQYIDTGKVKLVYRDFPLSFHPQAQKAAEAAECAGEQGKYYEMHDKLFGSGVQGGVDSFKQYAKDIGLNSAQFDNCLDSGQMAEEILKDTQDGQAAGVTGTPGFKVGTQLISGAQPFSVFKAAIDAELAKAGA